MKKKKKIRIKKKEKMKAKIFRIAKKQIEILKMVVTKMK